MQLRKRNYYPKMELSMSVIYSKHHNKILMKPSERQKIFQVIFNVHSFLDAVQFSGTHFQNLNFRNDINNFWRSWIEGTTS